MEQADEVSAIPEEIKSPPRGTETVLLVDDDNFIGDYVIQALEKFGYRVVVASSGEEALAIYADRVADIDLVIMDIGMPGMGGHKCLLELLKFDPQVKVIISSGYSLEGQVRRTLEAGAAGYVAKPHSLNELLDKVRAVLDDRG